MGNSTADPGYGNLSAPIGSAEWAKRWRLEFQSVAKRLSLHPKAGQEFYEKGKQYRAWTLLTDAKGKHFRTWEAFCSCDQPWGLGMDPVQFKAFLDAVEGKKVADLETVSPGDDKGGAPKGNQNARKGKGDGETTGATVAPVVSEASGRKEKNLRAILRAPEVVQELYKADRITQADAAKLGPKSPTPEVAAKVAEARQEIEEIDRGLDKAKFRKEVAKVVSRHLGKTAPTVLERILALVPKLTKDEKQELIRVLGG